ncbi:uncharacterized protein LOC110723683 [Chenopodium quinoa]|uniref:uncharacterized protein LOC110723683 n=1 Tax=Chenopodium quinoa TaxID=63459 RepID=UPI000B77703D|nr:uncharacterized protein LOC110723683 [Chenopodium quinoa]
MMVQSKIKVKENGENGVGASKRRSIADVDHWAFLEEIEAPMWADLTLETALISEDNDDKWFHTSHPFHHLSARHLRSAFAHPDVGNDLFNLCSPKFPSSVSKSRGKDYRSKDCISNCREISANKEHPVNDLGGTISATNIISSQEFKPKVSHDHQSEASSSITSVVNYSERRVALNSQSASTSGVSTSTITNVSIQRDSKVFEVSKEPFGQTGGLLNALRNNLRKSRATRPASRVEICEDRELNGRKSSAGKSSVGSSSTGLAVVPRTDRSKQVKVEMNINIGSKGQKTSYGRPNQRFSNSKLEVKKMPAGFKQNKYKNPNVRDMGKLAKPVNERVKATNMNETSVCTSTYSSKMKGKDDSSKMKGKDDISKMKVKDAAAASRSLAASKSKVVLQTTQKNSLNRSKNVAQGVKAKVQSSWFDKAVSSGKENMRGKAVLSLRSGGKDNEPVVRVSELKVHKLKLKTEVGVTSIRSKGRISRMNDGSRSLDTRVHLR